MFKRFLLTLLIFFGFIGVFYPSNKENTRLIDYCYSFEKIISRNSVRKRKSLSGKVKSITRDVAKFGVSKTEGALINKIIDEYKTSKDSFIINFLPNKIYCLGGYWIEKFNPGKFESILFEKSQKTIKDLKELKEDLDLFIKDFNSDYKSLIDELYKAF
tara:strand:- start:299 stop:775 length:477 start_codon:yes stop_codon:yes gene_type:complete